MAVNLASVRPLPPHNTMTERELREVVHEALNAAAAAVETATHADTQVGELRIAFDKFKDQLPEELAALGILTLTREQSKFLVERLTLEMAQRMVADYTDRTRERRSGFWDHWWTRAAAGATMLGIFADIVLQIGHSLRWW